MNLSSINTHLMRMSLRVKVALLALALMGVVFATMVLLSVLRGPSPSEVGVTTETFPFSLDMAVAIPVLFQANALGATYDWALFEAEDGKDLLVESTTLERQGQTYEFLLSTKKAHQEDEDFTLPDYMALTLSAVGDDGETDTIVYIDLLADGELDSVFLNDVQITEASALNVARAQYASEVILATDSMIGR